MVGCNSCGGSPVTSTISDCCDHDIEPSGFAYTIPGVDGCNITCVQLARGRYEITQYLSNDKTKERV